MSSADRRVTRTVIESHLDLARRGELEDDLRQNYADDVVLLSAEGVHHGHDGVRFLASVLRGYLEGGEYDYEQVLVEGEYAMLVWSATSPDVVIHDGADSYVVRDGLIRMQSIHYSVRSQGESRRTPGA